METVSLKTRSSVYNNQSFLSPELTREALIAALNDTAKVDTGLPMKILPWGTGFCDTLYLPWKGKKKKDHESWMETDTVVKLPVDRIRYLFECSCQLTREVDGTYTVRVVKEFRDVCSSLVDTGEKKMVPNEHYPEHPWFEAIYGPRDPQEALDKVEGRLQPGEYIKGVLIHWGRYAVRYVSAPIYTFPSEDVFVDWLLKENKWNYEFWEEADKRIEEKLAKL